MSDNISKSPIKVCKYDEYIQPPQNTLSYERFYSNKTKKLSLHKHRLSGLLNPVFINKNTGDSIQKKDDSNSKFQTQNISQRDMQDRLLIKSKQKQLIANSNDNTVNKINNKTLFRKNLQKNSQQKQNYLKLQKLQAKSVTIKFEQVLDYIPNNRGVFKTNSNFKTKTTTPFKIFEMAENKYYLQLLNQNKKDGQKSKQTNSNVSIIDSLFNIRSIKMIKKFSEISPARQQSLVFNQTQTKNKQRRLSPVNLFNQKKRNYDNIVTNESHISQNYERQYPIIQSNLVKRSNIKLSLNDIRKIQSLQQAMQMDIKKSKRTQLMPLSEVKNRDHNNQNSDKQRKSYKDMNLINKSLSHKRRNSKQFTPMIFSLSQNDCFSSNVDSNNKILSNKSTNKRVDINFEQKINKYQAMLRKISQIHEIDIIFPTSYSRNQFNFYVGKGNNSKLIKQTIKKRWWLGNCQQKKDLSKNNIIWTQLKDKSFYKNITKNQASQDKISQLISIHNHFEQNQFLGNKKALYYNMKSYYQSIGENVFDYLPLTYHVINQQDQSFKQFIKSYNKFKQEDQNCKNTWIVKPGQNSNRGNGITVHQNLQSILSILSKSQKQSRTYILQKYIQKPFLYNKRKFDIRCYMLLTRLNGKIKGFWYKEGYIRTSGYQFTLNDCDNSFIHLTNDAIQQNCDNYGKFQDKNKLSYQTFQKYLDTHFNLPNQQRKYDFQEQIIPKLRKVCIDSIKASHKCIGQWKVGCTTFQLFGLDFMIDQNFNPWLIEINTNPCLQTEGRVLQKVIVPLVDNVFKLTIDCLFPPPLNWSKSNKHLLSKNVDGDNFELVFDQNEQIKQINQTNSTKQNILDKIGEIDQDNELYGDQE